VSCAFSFFIARQSEKDVDGGDGDGEGNRLNDCVSVPMGGGRWVVVEWLYVGVRGHSRVHYGHGVSI